MLAGAGVETRRMFTPVHCQPFLDLRLADTGFPVSVRLADEGILLPSFVDLTDAMIDRVAGLIEDIGAGRLSQP
jgi:dTDP-4-amino-4,6-dideoxygalactose transaminase